MLALVCPAAGGHPVHLSSTRLDLRRDRPRLEVQVRSFTDDLEEAITRETGTRLRIAAVADAATDSLVARHLRGRLVIRTDGRAVALRYVGYERVEDAVEAYFEAGLPEVPGAVEVDQRLLLDQFSDQQNLLFLYDGATRRSGIGRPGQSVVRWTVP